MVDYGFRAVVSSFFGDIFKNNALNTGLLPVQISDGFLKKLLEITIERPEEVVRIDLEAQEICLLNTGEKEHFNINPYKKECLQNGYDDIDYLISILDKVTAFEENQ